MREIPFSHRPSVKVSPNRNKFTSTNGAAIHKIKEDRGSNQYQLTEYLIRLMHRPEFKSTPTSMLYSFTIVILYAPEIAVLDENMIAVKKYT